MSDIPQDFTAHEKALLTTIHNLKAARMACPDDDAETRGELQHAIYVASQELAATAWGKRQRASNGNS